MLYLKSLLIFALCAAVFAISCFKYGAADLVLRGGKIATVDKDFSIKEAVAVRGDKIVFVGSNKEVASYIGSKTEVIELDGKLVLPGLIDAHAHLASYGAALENLDLTGTTSYQQIVDIVATKVKTVNPGEWIQGRGWDQNDWDVKEFPTHDDLSRVSPDNPVFLTRVCGHAVIVNEKAMEIAGLSASSQEPPGGKIFRKANGEPTGVLIDEAEYSVKSKIPKMSGRKLKEIIENASKSCLSVGLTGMHDAWIPVSQIKVYKELIDEGRLGIRIYAMLADPDTGEITGYLQRHKIENYGNNFLKIRSVKLFTDGALGSRGAAFFEPYEDDPENTGLLMTTSEHIYEVAKAALAVGMGVNTHCIGIRGNHMCLAAYEKALKENPKKDHRFRIEHAQIVRDEEIKKFASLNIIPSMQPIHCTSDMPFVEDRIGRKRAEGAYAWRSFIDAGLIIPCGSDFPVESNNPMLGIYAAITRQDTKGLPEGGWFPEQRMTIEEAIKGFTIWAAYAAFQEDILGSVEVDKLADFTILDKDILEIEPREIITAKPVYTIVGGKIRYSTE